VLIRVAILKRIKAGEVTLAFRRWRKPTVKSGGTLRTPLGTLCIQSIAPTALSKISAADARRAGYDTRSALMSDLQSGPGTCYRIELAYEGHDTRVALRARGRMKADELETLLKRLDRMDSRSGGGPWTLRVLRIIDAHPQRVSTELAEHLDVDRLWLKRNIRKLKDLGLTISYEVGYKLSSRGRAVLKAMKS
jgi:hypothetical protein